MLRQLLNVRTSCHGPDEVWLSHQVDIFTNNIVSVSFPWTYLGLCTLCCLWIDMRSLAYRLGESPMIVCCVPGAMIILRTKLRLLTGIKVNFLLQY